ncbi:glycoprotein hormone beta-5 isoform X1 [Acanthopagrus latus]|uniref:glycoprotein hormone beta-5 isoform X1 n=1 Tax=Acanthopagrus latus TaxID=8177 RepID=UPI00187CC111|nr:glycoprotein hormone beta-5 isoform X1 [Acanthopagrus latus]
MNLQKKKSQRSSGLVLLLLLCVSLQPRVSAVNLRRFIGCAVREFTFLARKPGCGGLHITTDACWGRCETWEGGQGTAGREDVLLQGQTVTKPVLDPPFIESYQRVCTYNETRLVSVKLPNCQPSVDPTYTYPVALRCDCGVCLTSTTECITSV